jgi:cytochrome c-type biogenesis protein CcmH/NrfG
MRVLPTGAFLTFAIAAGVVAGIPVQLSGHGQAAAASREGLTEAELEAEFTRKRGAVRSAPEFQAADAETHRRLGDTLHHRGDLTGATEEYRAAITLDPNLAGAYRGLGAVLLDRHEWTGAVEALRAATRLRADDAEAFYWLGRGLMARQEWSGATAALQRAVQLKPDDAEAHADLGLVRMAQGRPVEAAEALRQAVRLKPDNADAHRLLEIVTAFQHDAGRVIREARRILDTLFARE